MNKFLIMLVCCSLTFTALQAQTGKTINTAAYRTAIGLRVFPFGVSFKTNSLYRKTSFELIGYFKDGFTASGLYYWNFILNQPGNIKLYAGGGGQVGFKNESAGGGAIVGVVGIVGADYKFVKLPINLSLDWQPAFQFGKTTDFIGYGGIAARFAF